MQGMTKVAGTLNRGTLNRTPLCVRPGRLTTTVRVMVSPGALPGKRSAHGCARTRSGGSRFASRICAANATVLRSGRCWIGAESETESLAEPEARSRPERSPI